jgi:hypothetical protein
MQEGSVSPESGNPELGIIKRAINSLLDKQLREIISKRNLGSYPNESMTLRAMINGEKLTFTNDQKFKIVFERIIKARAITPNTLRGLIHLIGQYLTDSKEILSYETDGSPQAKIEIAREVERSAHDKRIREYIEANRAYIEANYGPIEITGSSAAEVMQNYMRYQELVKKVIKMAEERGVDLNWTAADISEESKNATQMAEQGLVRRRADIEILEYMQREVLALRSQISR